jgi:hypothetical protein
MNAGRITEKCAGLEATQFLDGTRGFVMLRKRRKDPGVMPPEAAMAMSAVTAARQWRCTRPGSRPSPSTVHSIMASPRACLASAPRCDMGDSNTSTGAGRVYTGELKDAWCGRASASPRASQPFGRCRIYQDMDGKRADGIRGAGFAKEDEPSDGLRGFEEVVLHLSTAIGTDWTHDVLRDPGAATMAGPRASFSDSRLAGLGRWRPCPRRQAGLKD